MECADRNIDELIKDLLGTFHRLRLRQDSIDAELFDLISGYESLARQAQRDPHP